MSSEIRKGKRLEASRLEKAKALAGNDTCRDKPPAGAVMADAAQLVHNNTYGFPPKFYVDRVVACRNCANEEVWPAEQQKWWYEEVKANINSDAVLCRSCRDAEKNRKTEARRVQQEGLVKKAKAKGRP